MICEECGLGTLSLLIVVIILLLWGFTFSGCGQSAKQQEGPLALTDARLERVRSIPGTDRRGFEYGELRGSHTQDKQVFRLLGPVGFEEVSAREVKFNRAENRVTLLGQVAGTIHSSEWTGDAGFDLGKLTSFTSWRFRADEAEFQVQGVENALRLASLTAIGNIWLAAEESLLYLKGDRLIFNAPAQSLKLEMSGDSASFQSVHCSTTTGTYTITAQTIGVLRRERLEGTTEGTAIRPELVLQCRNGVMAEIDFPALARAKKPSKYVPQTFTIAADRLVFICHGGRTPAGATWSYAEAEGKVILKVYDGVTDSPSKAVYRFSGSRAFLQRAPFFLELLGDGKGGEAAAETPDGTQRAPTIQVRQRPDRTLQLKIHPGLLGVLR